MSMKYLDQISKQFLALSVRERVMAIAALLGVLYFIFDFALFTPQQKEAKALRDQIARQDVELAAFATAVQQLSSKTQVDPLAKERAERDEIRRSIAQSAAQVGNISVDIRVGELIRAMVASTPGLTLVSLKTLPVETFFKAGPTPATAASGSVPAAGSSSLPTLYKHGVEVTVNGKYVSLIPYLQGLERNTKGIFWSSVKVDVGTYPDAQLKMIIYTLSPRPDLALG